MHLFSTKLSIYDTKTAARFPGPPSVIFIYFTPPSQFVLRTHQQILDLRSQAIDLLIRLPVHAVQLFDRGIDLHNGTWILTEHSFSQEPARASYRTVHSSKFSCWLFMPPLQVEIDAIPFMFYFPSHLIAVRLTERPPSCLKCLDDVVSLCFKFMIVCEGSCDDFGDFDDDRERNIWVTKTTRHKSSSPEWIQRQDCSR